VLKKGKKMFKTHQYK